MTRQNGQPLLIDPAKPRIVATARKVLIEICADDAGNVTAHTEVDGDEAAKAYVAAIATCLGAAVESAMKQAPSPGGAH
jgi:hypothetical protein